MRLLLGVVRFLLALIVLVLGVAVVLLVGWLPWHIQNRRPAAWVGMGLSRLSCWIFNVRVFCPQREMLLQHRGFLFANHQTYADALTLLSIMPVRFLAAAEVRRYPLIGWIASAIGTVFVDRNDHRSRTEARTTLGESFRREPEPPLVLFPEGRLGPGDQILPFRYGAFELALQHQLSFLLCAIRYRPMEIAIWRAASGELLLTAAWRLAQYPGPVYVDVLPVMVITPAPDVGAQQLAEDAQLAIRQTLGL
jgi:1-acyl-sn-glycerol-3-phosphate acyltransferase